MTNTNDYTYGLELADGSIWALIGDDAVTEWLGELARIMELSPIVTGPTYTIHFHGVKKFTLSPNPNPYGTRSLEKGWKPFRNGGIQRVWRHDEIPEIHVELHQDFLDHEEIRYINMWSVLREIHHHALKNGGTPVHATLVALNEKGVLIAGAGGTGKSTCCSRLPRHWDRLCDDQALVLHIGHGDFRVHPLPTWSDHLWKKSNKQWPIERSVPLKAVFFLEQALTDKVVPLKDSSEVVLKYFDAAKQVWQPAWSRIKRKEKSVQSAMLFDNVTRLAKNVPAFQLRASLNGRFWVEIEKVFTTS